jgi:hypothetical protein
MPKIIVAIARPKMDLPSHPENKYFVNSWNNNYITIVYLRTMNLIGEERHLCSAWLEHAIRYDAHNDVQKHYNERR